MSKEYIFDNARIQSRLNSIGRLTYVIAVDTVDIPTYCLVRSTDENSTVLLLKQIQDVTEFETEVANLSKYFNAEVYGKVKPLITLTNHSSQS